MQMAKQHQV